MISLYLPIMNLTVISNSHLNEILYYFDLSYHFVLKTKFVPSFFSEKQCTVKGTLP